MIPDKLTADLSENYKVSIRLMPDGLYFWGYNPSENDSFFIESFTYERQVTTVEELKNIVFEHPCFSFSYQSFHVVHVGGKYTIIPDPVFIEKEKDRLFDFCFPKDPSLKTIVHPVHALDASILFGLDKDVYAFLLRSLTNPQFIHSISPLLIAWQKKSLPVFPKLMHVAMHQTTLDVLCVEQGNLLFLNSYSYENSQDAVYYIMYICKQTGFNQLEDYITVSGRQDLCRPVLSVIHKYVKKTNYFQHKVSNYQDGSALELTPDMIALMECGL